MIAQGHIPYKATARTVEPSLWSVKRPPPQLQDSPCQIPSSPRCKHPGQHCSLTCHGSPHVACASTGSSVPQFLAKWPLPPKRLHNESLLRLLLISVPIHPSGVWCKVSSHPDKCVPVGLVGRCPPSRCFFRRELNVHAVLHRSLGSCKSCLLSSSVSRSLYFAAR